MGVLILLKWPHSHYGSVYFHHEIQAALYVLEIYHVGFTTLCCVPWLNLSSLELASVWTTFPSTLSPCHLLPHSCLVPPCLHGAAVFLLPANRHFVSLTSLQVFPLVLHIFLLLLSLMFVFTSRLRIFFTPCIVF